MKKQILLDGLKIYKDGQIPLESILIIIDRYYESNHATNKAVPNRICECGNVITEKEQFYETCLQCSKTL